ncbi:MAG TPA: GNAT family N-acetyltransferase [Stellaceae bacterium]|jgi:ribosomal protein S18 acetylase RimI-like enzyme|nr:GNAT family N-acetyltransferase [Stellaceae bacterium]
MSVHRGDLRIGEAGAGDIGEVRRLFCAYAASLPFSLEYQGFAGELAGLPAPYAPPEGGLLLAHAAGAAVGVVALKPLGPGIAEIKRLYVVPEARGAGVGRRLAERALAIARAKGYERVRLDTHRPTMAGAMALYRALGFREIAPYGPNPGGEIAFFEKPLRPEAQLEVRDAVAADAAAACTVLRRSFAELCIADHHGDPAILAAWLANKTPEIVASWIARPDSSLLVAVEGDQILGVGGVTDTGEITLNYVSPDARFCGVSRALLAALEARAAAHGNDRCTLVSTETAFRFYRAAGYEQTGPPQHKFGTSASYPMAKSL